MWLLIVGFLVFLGVAAEMAIWSVRTKKEFAEKELCMEQCLSKIQKALVQRYTLLMRLTDASRGYLSRELDLLMQTYPLKENMEVREMAEAEHRMDEMSNCLFTLAEDYPDLRSSEIFTDLERQIKKSQQELRNLGILYNENAAAYNTAVASFPTRLLADQRKPRNLYEAAESRRSDIQIQS